MVFLLLSLLNVVVFLTIRPGPIRTYMDENFGSNAGRLSIVLVLFCTLLVMYWMKYKHPFASIFLLLWIILSGLGIGLLSLYASSYGFLQILIYVYLTVLLNLFFSQLTHNKLFRPCSKVSQNRVQPNEGDLDLEIGSQSLNVETNREEELVTCLHSGLFAFFWYSLVP